MPHSPRAARPDARPRLPRRALAVALVTGVLTTGPAAAMVRDVEIRSGPSDGGALVVRPPVSLARDVTATASWAVEVANTSDAPVEVDLAVRHLVADLDGAPGPGGAVAWATLPRDHLSLRAGDIASMTVGLSPDAGDLPTAIALVVTTTGEDQRQVVASRVLWPAGHAPQVTIAPVDLNGAAANADDAVEVDDTLSFVVADAAGPVVLDVRVQTTAWPTTSTMDAGPLVLLAAPRRVDVPAPTSLLGTTVDVVAAVDGTEVARASFGPGLDPARLALVTMAALAVLATAGLGIRALRR